MMNSKLKLYDQSIECTIVTQSDTFSMTFCSEWKISDLLSWMFDTYCIEEDDVVQQTISFVKRYKLKKS